MTMARHRAVPDTEKYTGREKLEENEVSGNDIPWQSIANDFASHRVYDIWLDDVDRQKHQNAGNVKPQFNVPRLVKETPKLEKVKSGNEEKHDHQNTMFPIPALPDISEYAKMSSLLTNDYRGSTLPLNRKMNSPVYNWRPKIYTAARNQIADQFQTHDWLKTKPSKMVDRKQEKDRKGEKYQDGKGKLWKEYRISRNQLNGRRQIFPAPRKWYQNTRRNIMNQEKAQSRHGKYLPRRFPMANQMRRKMEANTHHMFPKSFNHQHSSLMQLGDWHSSPVLDNVIRVS